MVEDWKNTEMTKTIAPNRRDMIKPETEQDIKIDTCVFLFQNKEKSVQKNHMFESDFECMMSGKFVKHSYRFYHTFNI